GAYASALDPERAAAKLAEARVSGEEPWRAACRALMGAHASTRERAGIVDHFYEQVFAITGPPRTVLDVACGLGPVALPWMGLPPEAMYVACDVDSRIVQT